jgi:putative addiction module component (TIGR02574 family)
MKRLDLQRQAFELPLEEQLDLAQALWDHASPPGAITSEVELAELLDARHEEALRAPEAARPWPEVKARLLAAK